MFDMSSETFVIIYFSEIVGCAEFKPCDDTQPSQFNDVEIRLFCLLLPSPSFEELKTEYICTRFDEMPIVYFMLDTGEKFNERMYIYNAMHMMNDKRCEGRRPRFRGLDLSNFCFDNNWLSRRNRTYLDHILYFPRAIISLPEPVLAECDFQRN